MWQRAAEDGKVRKCPQPCQPAISYVSPGGEFPLMLTTFGPIIGALPRLELMGSL